MYANDHEIKIGSTTKGLKLIRNEDGSAMYQVIEEIPQYRNPLRFTQIDWREGHGQHDFTNPSVYFEGQSIDTTQEGKVFLGPLIYSVGIDGGDLGANPVTFVWFSAISRWMCATATKVFWYDGLYFVEKKEFAGETITSLVEINGILYVSLGTSTKYYYSSDGATYTQTDLTDGYAEQIFAAPNPAGTATVLWKFKQPNELSNTTDGRTAAAGGVQWSSPAYVGDTSNNIVRIFLVNDNLMVGREDNLYHYDSNGGIHPLMLELMQNRSTTNFQYVVPWKSGAYFSLVDALGEISSYDTFRTVSPLGGAEFIEKSPSCVGLASEKDWLYPALKLVASQFPYTFPFDFTVASDVVTVIYKGKEISKGNEFRWAWCPWIYLDTNTCNTAAICQHTPIDRRLWFGYGNNAGYVALSANPLALGSPSKFTTSGFLRMSYDYGTDPNWDNLWQSGVLEVTGGATGETVQVKYRKDAETSATECIAAAVTNGIFETNFTLALSSKRIQFEIHLASDTNTATPEVSFFQAKGIEKPTTVRIHEATYSIGGEPSKSAEAIRTFLRGGRTSTSLISFADLRYGEKTSGTAGTDFVYVVMMPGSPQEVEIIHTKNRAPELGLRCRFMEVNYS